MNQKERAFLLGTLEFQNINITLKLRRLDEEPIQQREMKPFIESFIELCEEYDLYPLGSICGDDIEFGKWIVPGEHERAT